MYIFANDSCSEESGLTIFCRRGFDTGAGGGGGGVSAGAGGGGVTMISSVGTGEGLKAGIEGSGVARASSAGSLSFSSRER